MHWGSFFGRRACGHRYVVRHWLTSTYSAYYCSISTMTTSSWVHTDLQGLPSHHDETIPTWGYVFIASREGTPAPYNMA